MVWSIAAAAVLILCLAAAAIPFYFSSLIIFPRKVEYKKTFEMGVKSGEINPVHFENTAKEELFIDSRHGYKIHGILFPVEHSRKAVIIAHGITWSLFGSYKYVEMFHRRGYHVLLCDHRYHGLSGGSHTSFGFFEKDDLSTWVDCLFEKLGSGAFIGLLGESLGAATSLQYIKEDSRVGFCIADCPFSDLTALMRLRLAQDFKIRFSPLILLTSFVTKLRYGWGFTEISPIHEMEKVETPILFIHGKEDRFIPLQMSLDLFRRKIKGIKHLYLVPKAGHAQAFLTDRKIYEERVFDFLTEIELRTIQRDPAQ
ncbi:alpha/beta fold hydrolase [Bacillus mangrovi]|uniref:Alpha/beta fold hydrolase n=1 Tax=Metabacillus mangrovi TaxID=1491830 RepID=A0A7X2S4M6_9BACI|nr:alpha/beta hydrolase [Metabacillus mangrovi]MTH53569.1 alpha/beta fold hydrolase [Metabacillus mangrovi]